MIWEKHFDRIVFFDFEFCLDENRLPKPHTLVCEELVSGEQFVWFGDELTSMTEPPFPTSKRTLWVAYYGSAEMGCFLSLGWKLPSALVDLYCEFRVETNGKSLPAGRGLLGAATYHGITLGVSDEIKSESRNLAMRDGGWSDEEVSILKRYCSVDVRVTRVLFEQMAPNVHLPQALFRGRFMRAVAKMERAGIPLNLEDLTLVRVHWQAIQRQLTVEVDRRGYRCFVPTKTVPKSIADRAEAEGMDMYLLREVADRVYERCQAEMGELRDVIELGRKLTSLTPSKIRKLESLGRGHQDILELDKAVAEILQLFPHLKNHSDDPSDMLWELLKTDVPSRRSKYHSEIIDRAVAEYHLADPDDIYAGDGALSFNSARFVKYCEREGIPLEFNQNGTPKIDRDTLRELAKTFPQLEPIRQLRLALSELRLESLEVGADGYNRTLLSPFASKTGRSQPGSSRFVFGPSAWVRSFIMAPIGKVVVYSDWSGQELLVAGCLSGDEAMIADYEAGDFYTNFGIRSGLIPNGGTKRSHPDERAACKVVALGTLYGLSSYGISRKLQIARSEAEELLMRHRRAYPRFWQWSDYVVDHAMLHNQLQACFGWRMEVESGVRSTTLRNWMVQSTASEMMRLAACRLTECEPPWQVCCSVHDAFLTMGPVDTCELWIPQVEELMSVACEQTIGKRARVDHQITMPGERFHDERGVKFRERIDELLAKFASESIEDTELF